MEFGSLLGLVSCEIDDRWVGLACGGNDHVLVFEYHGA